MATKSRYKAYAQAVANKKSGKKTSVLEALKKKKPAKAQVH